MGRLCKEKGRASPVSSRSGNRGADVKVSMRLYSLQELLKQYLDWGFDFASISIATQISEEELRQLYSNENYRLRDKDKEKYLMVFLLQICCEKPDNDEYYKVLLESRTQYFKIPLEAIANYTGVDVDGLSGFESSSDKDRIEK